MGSPCPKFKSHLCPLQAGCPRATPHAPEPQGAHPCGVGEREPVLQLLSKALRAELSVWEPLRPPGPTRGLRGQASVSSRSRSHRAPASRAPGTGVHPSPRRDLTCGESPPILQKRPREWLSSGSPKLSSIKEGTCQSHVWPHHSPKGRALSLTLSGETEARRWSHCTVSQGSGQEALLDLLTQRHRQAGPVAHSTPSYREPCRRDRPIIPPVGSRVASHADREPRGPPGFPGPSTFHTAKGKQRSQGMRDHQFPRPLLCCPWI